MQPRDELRERERLGHVVVAAGGEARHAVGQRVTGGQEERGGLHALGAQCLQDVATVGVGQADVDDQDAGLLPAERLQELRTAADPGRLESFLAQASQEDAAQVGVVLDHHHLRHGANSAPRATSSWPVALRSAALSFAMSAVRLPDATSSSSSARIE